MWSKKKIFIITLLVLIILGIIIFLYDYRDKLIKVSIPFFIALIIAYIIRPIIVKLERKKIPCSAGILIIYFGFFLAITTITLYIIPELVSNTREIVNTLPNITLSYQNNVNGMLNFIETSNWPRDFKLSIFTETQNSMIFIENMVANTLKKVAASFVKNITIMFDIVLAMIIAYYLIKDSQSLKNSFLELVPRKWRNEIIAAGREMNSVLANFIQGQMLTALIVGTIETICLIIINVKYPIFLGLIGGLANLIPYFGPIIGGIPAVCIALIDSPIKAMWTVLAFVVVQQIDNAFISPRIIEGKIGLHPLSTILAVLVGGGFFGIIGMLVAVPIAAIIKIVFKRIVEIIV